MSASSIINDDHELSSLSNANVKLRDALGITTPRPPHASSAKWIEQENEMLEHQLALKAECEALLATDDGRKQALFLLQFFRSIPLPMWAASPDAKIVHWEASAVELYKHPQARALGKDFVELFVVPPEQKQARDDLSCIVFGQSGSQHFNLCKDRDKTGKQVYLVTCCFPVFDTRGQQIVQAEVSFDLSRLESLKDDLDKIYGDHRTSQEMVRVKDKKFLEDTVQRALDDLKTIADAQRRGLSAKINRNNAIISDSRSNQHEVKVHKDALQAHQNSLTALDSWEVSMRAAIKVADPSLDELEALRSQITNRGLGNVPMDN
jgi:PAS domain-containing protein